MTNPDHSSRTIDAHAAITFLQKFSRPTTEPDGAWLVYTIDPSAKYGAVPHRVTAQSLPSRLQTWADSGQNVYWQVALGNSDKRSSKSECLSIDAVWIDADPNKDPRETSAQCVDRVYTVLTDHRPNTVPAPTLIVETGRGIQAIWRIAPQPLPQSQEAVESVNRWLAETLGVTAGTPDVTRLLRLPGSWNCLDDNKIDDGYLPASSKVSAWADDPDRVYALSDFGVGKAHPKSSGDGKSTDLSTASADHTFEVDDVTAEIIPVTSMNQLDEYKLPLRIRWLISKGTPSSDLKEYDRDYGKLNGRDPSDRSVWLYDVNCQLLRHGVPHGLMLGLVTDPAWGISGHIREQSNPEYAARRQIAKAMNTIARDKSLETTRPARDGFDFAHSSWQHVMQQIYCDVYAFGTRDRTVYYSPSDADCSDMFGMCGANANVRRIAEQGDWVFWNGSYWRRVDPGVVRSMLQVLADLVRKDKKNTQRIFRETPNDVISIWRARYKIDDTKMNDKQVTEAVEGELKKMDAMVSKMNSSGGRASILSITGDRLMVGMEELDRNECEVVFDNLSWNATTNEFYTPRQESFATRSVGMEWHTPDLESRHRWRDYLGTLGFDEQTLLFMQRSFGYSLLGQGTMKRFWWFRGEGDTSKSTIIEIFRRAVGSYAEVTATDVWLAKSGSRQGHTDELAALQGARIVMADEFPKISRFDDALIKRCTGGAIPMRASFKGKSGFTYKVRFAMFFASNFDPQLAEDDAASMARLTTLTFKTKIEKKDPEFVNKFLSHGDNRLAVLDWAMEGARQYLVNGLGEEPSQIVASRKDFVDSQVSIADQVDSLIEPDVSATGKVSLNAVLERLGDLQSKTRQRAAFTTRQITKILRDKKYESHKSNGQIVFDGCRLIEIKQQPSAMYSSRRDQAFGEAPN